MFLHRSRGWYAGLKKPCTSNLTWKGLTPGSGSSSAPYRDYNIGGSDKVERMVFIRTVEDRLVEIKKELLTAKLGDVLADR